MDDGFRFMAYVYGKPTGHWVGDGELRIGFEPEGICVALSTGQGGWPLRYAVDSHGKVLRFEDEAKAREYCAGAEAWYKESKMQ